MTRKEPSFIPICWVGKDKESESKSEEVEQDLKEDEGYARHSRDKKSISEMLFVVGLYFLYFLSKDDLYLPWTSQAVVLSDVDKQSGSVDREKEKQMIQI